jgi:hypothetical protein
MTNNGKFIYTQTDESESLVVTGNVVRTVASSHPKFAELRDYCFAQRKAGEGIDIDHALKLIDAGQVAVDTLRRVTDRVSYKGGKLLWDGEPVDSTLANHIVRMIKEGDENYVAFARFLENLDQNPSEASKKALYDFIAARDFTITDEGHFVGYKGVRQDYTSLQSGYGIVNGVEHDGRLDNSVGNVVEVPSQPGGSGCQLGLLLRPARRDSQLREGLRQRWSDDHRRCQPSRCRHGPRDGNGHKMRVCKYVVLADNEEELTTTTYTGTHRVEDSAADSGPSTGSQCDVCGYYITDTDDGCECGGDPDNCSDCTDSPCSCDGCDDGDRCPCGCEG